MRGPRSSTSSGVADGPARTGASLRGEKIGVYPPVGTSTRTGSAPEHFQTDPGLLQVGPSSLNRLFDDETQEAA
jgi:hypothetical protein